MKFNIIVFIGFICFSCEENLETVEAINNKDAQLDWKNDLIKSESIMLAECLPDSWKSWEVFEEEGKSYLAHIGKGEYDLNFSSTESEETQIKLHFYPISEETREAVIFTQKNATIISSLNFAHYFGETENYLIYECGPELLDSTKVVKSFSEVRICLTEKLTQNIK